MLVGQFEIFVDVSPMELFVNLKPLVEMNPDTKVATGLFATNGNYPAIVARHHIWTR